MLTCTQAAPPCDVSRRFKVTCGTKPHMSACSLPKTDMLPLTLTLVLFEAHQLQGLRLCCVHVAGPGAHHA